MFWGCLRASSLCFNPAGGCQTSVSVHSSPMTGSLRCGFDSAQALTRDSGTLHHRCRMLRGTTTITIASRSFHIV